MDWGPVLAALITATGTVTVSVLGLRLAQKLGIGPVQGQYVDILSKLNAAKDDRIAQLEDEDASKAKRIAHLEQQVETLEGKVDDLEQTVFELRQDLAEERRRKR